MTIYILSRDHVECSQMLDDKSLSKMITTIAHVLCNVHWSFHCAYHNCDEHDYDCGNHIPLGAKTGNSEFEFWARTCVANYNYLVELGMACCEEYFYRFQPITGYRSKRGSHKHRRVIDWARNNAPDLPRHFGNDIPLDVDTDNHAGSITDIPLVMPEKFKSELAKINPVLGYQWLYQRKLQAGLRRKVEYLCPTCEGDQEEITEDKCLDCNGDIYILHPKPITPQWSRREKPKWLRLNAV